MIFNNSKEIEISNNYLKYANSIRKHALNDYNDQLSLNVKKEDIKKVILILAASRSGSSLLYEILKQTDQLMSLDGECTPFYKLHKCSFPFNNLKSDLIESNNSQCLNYLDNIFKDIALEIGIGSELQKFCFKDHSYSLIRRLALQWPNLGLSLDQWESYLNNSYAKINTSNSQWNINNFYSLLIKDIQFNNNNNNINYLYYDDTGNKKKFSKNENFNKCPPNKYFCIEEPPFIFFKPRKRPCLDEYKSLPLIIKTSVDAYRVSFVKKLFPKAEFKIIYLKRNPAASIHGLFKGWLHKGFYSHNLKNIKKLKIEGYSDIYEWGTNWWKFDLPPEWEKVTSHPLEYVCGFQWMSANKSIIENINLESQNDILIIKFEDFIENDTNRQKIFNNICKFIGIKLDNSINKFLNNLPVVMATESPSNYRWKKHYDKIMNVVNQKDILELSKLMGYSINN